MYWAVFSFIHVLGSFIHVSSSSCFRYQLLERKYQEDVVSLATCTQIWLPYTRLDSILSPVWLLYHTSSSTINDNLALEITMGSF